MSRKCDEKGYYEPGDLVERKINAPKVFDSSTQSYKKPVDFGVGMVLSEVAVEETVWNGIYGKQIIESYTLIEVYWQGTAEKENIGKIYVKRVTEIEKGISFTLPTKVKQSNIE